MLKTMALAVLVALTVTGCAFKMGNAQFDVLEGLSHPSNTTTKTETVTPTIPAK